MVKSEWIDYGYTQKNRSTETPVWDATWWCGKTGNNTSVDCGC